MSLERLIYWWSIFICEVVIKNWLSEYELFLINLLLARYLFIGWIPFSNRLISSKYFVFHLSDRLKNLIIFSETFQNGFRPYLFTKDIIIQQIDIFHGFVKLAVGTLVEKRKWVMLYLFHNYYMELQIKATKDHCKYCWTVLQAKLNKKKIPDLFEVIPNVQVPLFVTWLTKGELRGCIGTFQAQPLAKNLGNYALISALNDDRFDPIALNQLPELSVGVSLLVNFTPNKSVYEWEVGKHGIILQLQRNGKSYEGTFLPEVAKQEKWDQQTTIKHLLRKAGYNGPLGLVQKDIKITTYESSKAQMSFNEYKSSKNS